MVTIFYMKNYYHRRATSSNPPYPSSSSLSTSRCIQPCSTAALRPVPLRSLLRERRLLCCCEETLLRKLLLSLTKSGSDFLTGNSTNT